MHRTLPLRRRVLAASAGLGLALGLTACTIGETTPNNDDEVAATSSQTTVATSTSEQPATSAPADAPETPDTPVDQLVLNARDAPGLGLAAVPHEELSGGMDALSGLTESMRVEPAHCADVNQDAVLEQAAPGVMAIQAGASGQTPVSVGVTRDTGGIPGRTAQIEDCPTMSITMQMQGTEVTADAVNTMLPIGAPEGVEQFTAVSQETTMDMMGTPVRTGNVVLTGMVRGLGVSVTATGVEGPVPEPARQAALDAFAAQAEKIRAA